jgi:hypothetical protein
MHTPWPLQELGQAAKAAAANTSTSNKTAALDVIIIICLSLRPNTSFTQHFYLSHL